MKDDPIIRSIEATGYPPWVRPYYPGCPSCLEDEEGYDDYYDDENSPWTGEVMAVYDP